MNWIEKRIRAEKRKHEKWAKDDWIRIASIKIEEEIWDLIFSSYPEDMENFDTITENQAYRLLKTFWEKLEKINK